MALGGFEPTVKVVNRVVRADGTKVPYTAYFGGDTVTFTDAIHVPRGVARIIIHNSMYRQEPDTFAVEYKLGCLEMQVPEDPVSEEDVDRMELIDRSLLSPDRQFGAKDQWGRALKPWRRVYTPRRTDPISIVDPGKGDGAFSGQYGEPKKPD